MITRTFSPSTDVQKLLASPEQAENFKYLHKVSPNSQLACAIEKHKEEELQTSLAKKYNTVVLTTEEFNAEMKKFHLDYTKLHDYKNMVSLSQIEALRKFNETYKILVSNSDLVNNIRIMFPRFGKIAENTLWIQIFENHKHWHIKVPNTGTNYNTLTNVVKGFIFQNNGVFTRILQTTTVLIVSLSLGFILSPTYYINNLYILLTILFIFFIFVPVIQSKFVFPYKWFFTLTNDFLLTKNPAKGFIYMVSVITIAFFLTKFSANLKLHMTEPDKILKTEQHSKYLCDVVPGIFTPSITNCELK